MNNNNSSTGTILKEIDETVSELDKLISPLNEDEINKVPYKDSWTAGQLFRHVSKSVNGMAKVLQKPGEPANRDACERIPELKKAFLDFSNKMKSPEGIIPEDVHYEKQSIINELNTAFKNFNESAVTVKEDELIKGLPLGPITKSEIIHFTLYHSQRHLHQMRKICDAL